MSTCLALLNLGLKTASATGLIKSRADLALQNLDANVSSLIAQPFHEGLARLEQAATAVTPELRKTLLSEARGKFTDVAARPAAPLTVRAMAAAALASCWWNLDQYDLARREVLRAIDLQTAAIDELRAAWTMHSPHTSSSNAARNALPYLGLIGVAAYHTMKFRDAQTDSRMKTVEREMARSDGDTSLLLELAAQTGADGMSTKAAELRAKLPALPTA